MLNDTCDEWLDEPGQMLEDQQGPPAEEGLIFEEQAYATRSGEPLCHDAARKARAK